MQESAVRSRCAVLLALLVGSACAADKGQSVPAIPPIAPASADFRGASSDDDLDEDDDFEADPPAVEHPAWMKEAAAKITDHAKGKVRAWQRLAYVADHFGHRLSGSKSLERTIDWAVETMKADGLDNARREKVMVPHWVRGKESLRITSPVTRDLEILGLGMSVGTKGKIRSELVVVDNVNEVAKLEDVAGKVVLINQKMPPYDHEKHDSGYGTAVQARANGATEVSKKGGAAVLVRSVTAYSLSTPHTGALNYADGVRPIPAAAVTPEAADYLARMVDREEKVKVELFMGAKTLPDAVSGNAIAELTGREKPEEIVVIGGHIDSWDVGDGSTDDGSGCLMAMEAALMLKELGLIPRRTIRVVLFTNEENGLRGAKAYFEAHKHEKHVAAIEADSGSGAPWGFSIAYKDEAAVQTVMSYAPLFQDIGAHNLHPGWGGADISPLIEAGVMGIAVRPDGSHYFDLHHSPADTIDKIDADHLQRNAAAMALLAYILAERE